MMVKYCPSRLGHVTFWIATVGNRRLLCDAVFVLCRTFSFLRTRYNGGMSEPFCHSPQNLWHGQGTVLCNDRLTANAQMDSTWRLAIRTAETLPLVRAGQFTMLRLPDRTDPLLGRPFAIYRVEPNYMEIVYLVVGKMTWRLANVKPNETLELWMPLGNGFPETNVQHTIIVAGGIGQTPFLTFCQNRQERVSLLYGARTASRITCMDDFRQLGIEPMVATDDGSEGHCGLVTDLIEKVYKPGESTQLFCCGPLPMLRSAFLVARKLGLPCFVSLETPMSCGLGICFGCVVPYRDSEHSDWDYRRTCIDGPVFDAYKLRWE